MSTHRDAAAAHRRAAAEDIPGVTRRHNLKDLYHERTNFQFITHSRRWLILSSILILVSVGALVRARAEPRHRVRGRHRRGRSRWPTARTRAPPEVRDLLDPLGFGDAKVSTLSGQGSESVRVQAEVVEDPIRTIQRTLADAAEPRAGRRAVRPQRGRQRHVHVLRCRPTRRSRRKPSSRRCADAGQPDADGHRRRPERHGADRRAARRARCRTSPTALADVRGRRRERSQRQHGRPDVGRDGQPQGAPGARHLLRDPRRLPLVPLRVEDGRDRRSSR